MAKTESRYTFPDLEGREVLYRGRRYIAFAVSSEQPFEDAEDDGDFVIYDGLYDAVSAIGRRDEKGIYGELAFSHVEIEIEPAPNMRDFVQAAAKAQASYHRETVG